MWENETIVLLTSLKKRILGGREQVRFAKISADDALPNFIKTLFKKRVENLIDKESPFSVNSTPHFALSQSNIERLQSRFLDVLLEAASFQDKEIEEILREALVTRLDYLVKPVDTMRRTLFEKRTEVDLSTMDSILDPFKKHLPYAEELLKECRGQGKSSLNREEYGKVASNLLHRLTEKDPVKVVLQDFTVLTEFLSETKGEEVTKIEGSMIQDFLAGRNLWGFRKAVEVEMKLGREDFDSAGMEVTLKRYLELKEGFSQSEEKNIVEESVIEPEIEESKVEEVKPLAGTDDWDLEEVLGEETFTLGVEEEKKPLAEKPKQKPKPMRIIRREQKKEEKETETLEPDKASPEVRTQRKEGLRSLINGKTEKLFIKKLFGGNAEAYDDLLDKLDEAESWRVAKILIDNELFKRDVDPFSREAIKMVDLVYSRYYPEEGVGGEK